MVRHASHNKFSHVDNQWCDPKNRPDLWPWGTDTDHGQLVVGGMSIPQVLTGLGTAHTPLLLCDGDDLSSRMCTWASAMAEECWPSYGMNDATVCYDLSTMSAPAIARIALDQGLGLTVRSIGELSLAHSLISQHAAARHQAGSASPSARPRLMVDAPVLVPALIYAALDAHATIVVRTSHDWATLMDVLSTHPVHDAPQASIVLAFQGRGVSSSPAEDPQTHVPHDGRACISQLSGDLVRECLKRATAGSAPITLEGLHLDASSNDPAVVANEVGNLLDTWALYLTDHDGECGQAALSVLSVFIPCPLVPETVETSAYGAAHYARALAPAIRTHCSRSSLPIPHLIVDPHWAVIGPCTSVLTRVQRVDHPECDGLPTVWIDAALTDDLVHAFGNAPLGAVRAWSASVDDDYPRTGGEDSDEPMMRCMIASISPADSCGGSIHALLPQSVRAHDVLAMPAVGAMMLGRYATASFETAPGLAMLHRGEVTWAVHPQTVEAAINRFL